MATTQLAASYATAPAAWTQAYVGLPYVMGVGECGHRAALIWRQVFGLDIEVEPAFGDMSAAQTLIKAELAKPVWEPVPSPAEGDAVIMWKGHRLAHVGVWVAPDHVLHCTRAEGMVLTPRAELPEQGFQVFGFFRHKTNYAVAA